MPKGVYERIPGKNKKALQANNFQFKKSGRPNYSGKQNNLVIGARNKADGRGDFNQKKVSWLKHLFDLGYGMAGEPPNYVVQAVISMIPNAEVHELLKTLSKNLSPGSFSPILHLGFSAWFELFLKLDNVGMGLRECRPILEQIFQDIENILADRTDLDDLLAIECCAGTQYLEKMHNLNDHLFEKVVEKGKQTEIDLADNQNQTQGFAKFIPKVDIDLMKKDKEAAMRDKINENLVRLTLNNCIRFPIISEMAIEWLGAEFDHGLWRSKNFGTLAPISKSTWKLFANINDDEVAEAIAATNNLEKLFDRIEIEFPFGTDIFDKECKNNNGCNVLIKTHMAFPDVKRGYSYVHRIWRSWSPYIKCNCQKDSCGDTITWFDQAIWFILNHLEMVYPKYSLAGKMGCFLHFIQTYLKKPILAHIAYLHFRETMVNITNKLASNPECDVKAVFGDAKIIEVCEIMIKDEEFMEKKLNKKKKDDKNSSIYTPQTSGGSGSYMPPRVSRGSLGSSCKIIENIAELSDSIVDCTPGLGSVNKPKADYFQRNVDGVQTKLFVEKAGTRSNAT